MTDEVAMSPSVTPPLDLTGYLQTGYREREREVYIYIYTHTGFRFLKLGVRVTCHIGQP